MFIFVLLTLFSNWIWVDATEQISMGLSFTAFRAYGSSGPSSPHEDIVFVDLDLDGDEDMLRCNVPDASLIEAFENILTPTGRRWQENPALINGIDLNQYDSAYYPRSLGAADINDDGRDEIIISAGKPDYAFVNIGDPGAPYWESTPSLFSEARPSEPDFADIDGDGDLDMVGPGPTLWWNRGTPRYPSWEIDPSYFDIDEEDWSGEQPAWIDWDNDGVWDILFVKLVGMADPPPNIYAYILLHNAGSATEPVWEYKYADLGGGGFPSSCFTFLDWNQDGVEDVLIQGADYDGGYIYHAGKRTPDDISFREYPALTWGGIVGHYPAAADVNSDGIPELVLSEQELHYGLGSWYIIYYYYPHFRHYSAANNDGTLWQCEKHYTYYYEQEGYHSHGHLQYVDFWGDNKVDYVINIMIDNFEGTEYDGYHELYRNQGTRRDPYWVKDEEALKDIPPLFPSCILDVDGDGDMDVIGFLIEDSTLAGFLNTGSDINPRYGRYDKLVTGLEGISPTYLAAGDITDNDLDLADLAAGIKDGELTAFFNSGQGNPRWHKHEEVFKSLGVNGNPALCDADGDGDLDLYLVTGGRLHYYRNESTGGIAETPPTYLPSVSRTYIGREVEISLTVAQSDGEVRFLLYNAAGQRVMASSQKPQDGEVRFRISQQPGVYFYRASTEELKITGKVVLY